VLAVPASGYYAWETSRQRAVGNETPLGKRRWPRSLASINAATAPVGSRWPCGKRVTASVGSGGQYCGNAYRALLHAHDCLRSQSRRGECYDNAQAESRWLRFKTEEPERREWPIFTGPADAQASAADYFDYYNYERLHASIGYQTPYFAHQQLLQTTILNCPA